MKKILIFGTGSLGQSFEKKFASTGYLVTTASTRDLLEISGSKRIAELSSFTIILWCARDSGTPLYSDNSSNILYQLLDEIKFTSWNGLFAFISSAGEVYGNILEKQANEETPPQPISLYGNMKQNHEKLIQSIGSEMELKVLVLRVSNLYELSTTNQGIVGAILRNIEFGEDLKISGGEQCRDFIEINDCAKAVIQLIELNEEGVFNIATGKSISILKLISLIEKASGKTILYHADNDFTGVMTANFSIDKFFHLTRYLPIGIEENISLYFKKRSSDDYS